MVIGRGIRYFGEAWLAYRYGDAALAFMKANGGAISLGVVGLLGGAILAYVLWRKFEARRS